MGAAGLALALMATAGSAVGAARFIVLLVFFALGLTGPYYWLKKTVGKRQHEVAKTLPNALDLVTTCVEAGLG